MHVKVWEVVNVIDFHCHILPGIDDGSSSIEETDMLLREELSQGIDTVIATPHFYANHTSVSHFLEKRAHSLEKTEKLLQEKNLDLRLAAGAEVYYFPGMGKAQQLRQLCIDGTDLILVELPFAQWTHAIYEDVKDIIEQQKLTVILAHVERYYTFQKQKEIWDAMFTLPVIPQINAGSFVSGGIFHQKKSRFCFRFMQSHSIIMGSDCHNMSNRVPNLASGRKAISEKCGEQALTQMDAFAERILEEHEAPAEL